MQEIPQIVPCDDCGKPCGIFVCTGCWEKGKTKGRIEGLKKAIKIVEARQATADALNCGEEFMEPFRQILVFLKAEVWRHENPEEAEKSKTILGGF